MDVERKRFKLLSVLCEGHLISFHLCHSRHQTKKKRNERETEKIFKNISEKERENETRQDERNCTHVPYKKYVPYHLIVIVCSRSNGTIRE